MRSFEGMTDLVLRRPGGGLHFFALRHLAHQPTWLLIAVVVVVVALAFAFNRRR